MNKLFTEILCICFLCYWVISLLTKRNFMHSFTFLALSIPGCQNTLAMGFKSVKALATNFCQNIYNYLALSPPWPCTHILAIVLASEL